MSDTENKNKDAVNPEVKGDTKSTANAGSVAAAAASASAPKAASGASAASSAASNATSNAASNAAYDASAPKAASTEGNGAGFNGYVVDSNNFGSVSKDESYEQYKKNSDNEADSIIAELREQERLERQDVERARSAERNEETPQPVLHTSSNKKLRDAAERIKVEEAKRKAKETEKVKKENEKAMKNAARASKRASKPKKEMSNKQLYALAFIIPLGLMVIIYAFLKIYPFGDNVYLRCDSWHQYAPFFGELWEKIRAGGSFTYSWNIGMGTNFSAIIPYYLASPIDWLIFIFPKDDILEVISYIIALKVAASSLTCTIYLSKHFRTKRLSTIAFGLMYAMSAYMAGYVWNNMWLDVIIMLPIVFLGLEKLVFEDSCLLYALSLGFSIFSNYYIGIILCISCVLYYIVLILIYNVRDHKSLLPRFKYVNGERVDLPPEGIHRPAASDIEEGPLTVGMFFKKTFRFGFYSLIGGMCGAVMILPEAYALSLSASGQSSFPKSLSEYYPLIETFARHLFNVPTAISGYLPSLYCGIVILLLVPLYIIDKRVNLREKVVKVALLLFFILSFDLNVPDYIWHGFHFPNCLPSRQSFVYVFILVVIGYEVIRDLMYFEAKDLLGAFGIVLLFIVYTDSKFSGSDIYTTSVIFSSLGFVVLYLALMFLYRTARMKSKKVMKRVVTVVAFVVVSAELTYNMGNNMSLGCASRSGYLRDNKGVDAVVDYAEQLTPDEFYRIEKFNGYRTRNDGAWSNYRSTSVFTSITNYEVEKLFGKLGLLKGGNSYGFGGATPVTASLLGVKYEISNSVLKESSHLTYVYGEDGELLYQNNDALPIGFMIKSADSFDFNSSYNVIDAQNDLMQNLTGISDIFTYMGNLNADNCEIVPTADQYILVVVRNNSDCKTLYANINGETTTFNYLDTDNMICNLGFAHLGDEITVTGSSRPDLLVYSMSVEKLTEAMNSLKAGGLTVTKFSDTKIEGSVNAPEGGTMMFTIPYDEGWSVYVDGKKANTYSIRGAFIGVDMTAGSHDVKLKYTPKGLSAGFIITIIALVLIVILALLYRVKRTNKGSYYNMPGIIRLFV